MKCARIVIGIHGKDQSFMYLHGPYHGAVTLTCSPLPNHHHSQLSKLSLCVNITLWRPTVEWKYTSLHSLPRLKMVVSNHIHSPIALFPILIEQKAGLSPEVVQTSWRKEFCPCRDSNHNSSVAKPVTRSVYRIRFPASNSSLFMHTSTLCYMIWNLM